MFPVSLVVGFVAPFVTQEVFSCRSFRTHRPGAQSVEIAMLLSEPCSLIISVSGSFVSTLSFLVPTSSTAPDLP